MFDQALEALRKSAMCSVKMGNLKQVRQRVVRTLVAERRASTTVRGRAALTHSPLAPAHPLPTRCTLTRRL